jgi:hypothetical protein
VDNGFAVKPRAGLHRTYGPRDPVPVRQAVETDLDPDRTVAAAEQNSGDGSGRQGDHRHNQPPPGHATSDVVVDPETRERIYRERDVRAASRQHPDQAMLRQRAYGRAPAGDGPIDGEPHADIEA